MAADRHGARSRVARSKERGEIVVGMTIESLEMDLANGDIVRNKTVVAKLKYGKSKWVKMPVWEAAVQALAARAPP